MYVLECCSLSKVFKQGESAVYAVKDCNLKIPPQSFTVITGPSGSGKTTLLQLLAAFENPTTGCVRIGGKELGKFNDAELSRFRNTEIGFVFQDFRLLPILTAKENILLPTVIGNRSVSQMYLSELCNSLNLSDRLHHFPSQLSGGQQQRVAIARAMINQPKLLFADEPTGNLDKKAARELIDLMLASSKTFGQTVLMVTHDPDMIQIADLAYQMDDGMLKQMK